MYIRRIYQRQDLYWVFQGPYVTPDLCELSDDNSPSEVHRSETDDNADLLQDDSLGINNQS